MARGQRCLGGFVLDGRKDKAMGGEALNFASSPIDMFKCADGMHKHARALLIARTSAPPKVTARYRYTVFATFGEPAQRMSSIPQELPRSMLAAALAAVPWERETGEFASDGGVHAGGAR